MLPQTQAQLVMRGTRYTKKICKNIQHEHYDPEAKAYILDKLRITGKEDKIDFESIEHYNRTLSLHRRATRAKFVSRWTPTNLRQYELKQSPTPYCPLCKTKIETTEHITQCKSATAVQYRTQALETLEENLIKWDTHPEIVTLIIMVLSTEANPVYLQSLHSSNIHVQQIIIDQADISWNLVQLGILSTAWRKCQIECKK